MNQDFSEENIIAIAIPKQNLSFSVGEQMWTVDPSIATPRFFRDRFANAFEVPERGNWKAMRENPELMKTVEQMNLETQEKWHSYFQLKESA